MAMEISLEFGQRLNMYALSTYSIHLHTLTHYYTPMPYIVYTVHYADSFELLTIVYNSV